MRSRVVDSWDGRRIARLRVEGSKESLGGKEVHDRLKSRLVHSLMDREGATVFFMTVIPPGDIAPAERRARDMLNRAADLYGIAEPQIVVGIGDDVARVVIEESHNHDLAVLGVRGEPFIRTFFFGDVAHQIATGVECPSILTSVKAGPPKKRS